MEFIQSEPNWEMKSGKKKNPYDCVWQSADIWKSVSVEEPRWMDVWCFHLIGGECGQLIELMDQPPRLRCGNAAPHRSAEVDDADDAAHVTADFSVG